MKALNAEQLQSVRRIQQDIQPLALTSDMIMALVAEWEPVIDPIPRERIEQFRMADPVEELTGPTGPRWLFHLLGLPHRSTHVGLTTPSGLNLLQRRSSTKTDYPSMWDMAASGHVSEPEDGSHASVADAAMREIGEELFNLAPSEAAERADSLLDGGLTRVGDANVMVEIDDGRNPPFHNVEIVQTFAGTLNIEGMARLNPDPEEVAGVYCCSILEAWRILDETDVTPGCRESLPRFLQWLVSHR